MKHLEKLYIVKKASIAKQAAAQRVMSLISQGGPKGKKVLKDLFSMMKAAPEGKGLKHPVSPEALWKALSPAKPKGGTGVSWSGARTWPTPQDKAQIAVRDIKDVLRNENRKTKYQIPLDLRRSLIYDKSSKGPFVSELPGELSWRQLRTADLSPRFLDKMRWKRLIARKPGMAGGRDEGIFKSVEQAQVDSRYLHVLRRIRQQNQAKEYRQLLRQQQAGERSLNEQLGGFGQ